MRKARQTFLAGAIIITFPSLGGVRTDPNDDVATGIKPLSDIKAKRRQRYG